LLLALSIFAAYPEVLLGSQTFYYRDFGFFGYPLAYYHRESFWQGEIPLWNPLNNCGLPFLAQWNTLVLYPGSLFYLLFPLFWSPANRFKGFVPQEKCGGDLPRLLSWSWGRAQRSCYRFWICSATRTVMRATAIRPGPCRSGAVPTCWFRCFIAFADFMGSIGSRNSIGLRLIIQARRSWHSRFWRQC